MDDHTLYYWPIPFRGHFVRFVLAHVGASWEERAIDPATTDYPFLAQPLLDDHETGKRLAQTPAILMYLGRKYRLIEDPDETLKLICDAMDVLYEITRGHGAQMWTGKAWAEFAGTRLPRWMALHEEVGRANGLRPEAGHILGTYAPTLADLALAALWHTMVDKLPELRPILHDTAPALEGLVDRIAAKHRIAAMRARWPGPVYCAGEIEASIREMLAA